MPACRASVLMPVKQRPAPSHRLQKLYAVGIHEGDSDTLPPPSPLLSKAFSSLTGLGTHRQANPGNKLPGYCLSSLTGLYGQETEYAFDALPLCDPNEPAMAAWCPARLHFATPEHRKPRRRGRRCYRGYPALVRNGNAPLNPTYAHFPKFVVIRNFPDAANSQMGLSS